MKIVESPHNFVSGMMKVNAYADFDDLPQEYGRLFERASSSSFFYSLPWFRNFVKTVLGDGDRVRIYTVEENNSLCTPIAALATQYKTFPSNASEPRILSSLANYYTSLFGPLLPDSRHDLHKVIRQLVQAVCSDTAHWDIINLNPLDSTISDFTELKNCFQRSGMIVQTYFCFGNWYLQVNGLSYHEYFSNLPSSIRNTVTRKIKKFERFGRTHIEIISTPGSLEAAVAAYEKVYSASWKVPEPCPLFIRGLIRICAEMGWLRLGLAYIDDEPVAAQLWIVNGDTASIYKLAYDERFSQLSIGSVLTARLMEHVIEIDKVREVDYLTGDDPYKKDWMSHRRERWGIIAFNPRTINGLFSAIKHVGGRTLKIIMRNLAYKLNGRWPVYRSG